MKNIFDFLMISGVILGIIFIVATQFSKNGRDKSIIYLNLVVLFIMLNNLQALTLETIFVDANFFIHRMQIPWYVLIFPSFYTFLIYYLKIEKKISSFVYVSISLFVIEIVIRIALIPNYFNENNNFFIAKYAQIEEIVNASYSVFLFIKAIVILFNYSELYEQVLAFDNVKWLKNFMFFGSIVILMWICAILLNLDKVLNPEVFIYYPLRLSSTSLLYWISYQGFYNYSLMLERIELRKEIIAEPTIINGNSNTKESEEEKFLIIKNYIKKNKRFLDPSFSLERLSSEMGISTSKLSHLINQESGYNFPDYINLLRVEKAKKFLIKSDYSSYTIVAIGLECGFNSKSTFYTAFKKFTNVTPSEFKEQ
ncbi:AraC-type DNA-binding protein [Flavobacterium fluvii]|uniref:AraC-type DNA-binding protein n=1 Tax=Flavobacterium fluvii TaxID=468056 RepID=A0A1M5KEZ9_9FLAO|nr:helix-turn-helix domain-containing protein [Flavobacterium fluvii]SHG50753.1 AraC-type DNA-binding protein [Flavobacterium fluvii]